MLSRPAQAAPPCEPRAARRQGYYIESCARMRYKADFAPCDLLCSRAGAWLPFARVAAALRADPGCVLSQVRDRARRVGSLRGSAWVFGQAQPASDRALPVVSG
jgi:hypothetical protein